MKNIFRTRTSLIIACVVIGILIGSIALSGCRTSYGLIEGMETKKKVILLHHTLLPPPQYQHPQLHQYLPMHQKRWVDQNMMTN